MKIGLFDINKSAFNKSNYEYPEIDLMKVYSYYSKNKQNIVELSLNYTDYKNYDLYYCFNNSSRNFTKKLFELQSQNNVFLIGPYFYGDTWIPMDEEIEKCEPDINVYNPYFRKCILENKKLENIDKMLYKSYYIRYYYPDWHWNIIPNKIKDKKVIFYDYDFTSHEGWQELYLKTKRDSGKAVDFRHKVILKSLEDLRFAATNKMHLNGMKYPPKFILDIPEMIEDFPSFFKEYYEYFDIFPVRSLYIYDNHYYNNESELERFAKVVDICMYALSRKVQIYGMFDYSINRKNYDSSLRRLDFYFLGGRQGTVVEELQNDRQLPVLFLENMKKEMPIFYKKINEIRRDDVKHNRVEWIYGER